MTLTKTAKVIRRPALTISPVEMAGGRPPGRSPNLGYLGSAVKHITAPR